MKTALLVIAGGYVIVLVLAALFQRKLLYVPDTRQVAPASAGLVDVSETVLERPDGARLIAWYKAARRGKPTLLYFHGNGGNLAVRAGRMAAYTNTGLGFFMLGYRGYGGSTGQPTEAANVADAKAAYDWLRQHGVAAQSIVLYGESLGSGVAVQVAVEKPVAGLVLDAPYTSIPDVGQRHYRFLPVKWFALDRYDTIRHIRKVHYPILVIHGELDRITPVDMGRAVYRAAHEPKKIVTFPAAGHNDHHMVGAFDAVIRWIEALDARSGGRTQSATD